MEQSKKTMRHFYCRDALWEAFERMANDFDCSIDYLINESMRDYAKAKRYDLPSGASSQTVPPGLVDKALAAGPAAHPAPVIAQVSIPTQDLVPAPVPAVVAAPVPAPVEVKPPPAPPPRAAFGSNPPGSSIAMSQTPSPLGAVGSQPSLSPPMGLPRPPMPPPRPSGGSRSTPITAPPRATPEPVVTVPPLYVLFNGQTYSIDKDQFIIGRGSKSTDLPIKDGNISRKHAAVIRRNGVYYIKDLGSTNGIDYKGMRIDNKRIDEGDVFHLCDYELRFTFTG